MKVSVLLFARAKELAGAPEVVLDVVDSARIADVRDALVRQYPALENLAPSLLWAVDQQYVTTAHAITESKEIACFPPVSGG